MKKKEEGELKEKVKKDEGEEKSEGRGRLE